MPPAIGQDGCVKCVSIDAHVLPDKALECVSFLSYCTDAKAVKEAKSKEEQTQDIVPEIAAFFELASALDDDEQDEPKKKVDDKKVEWEPKSLLDDTIFDFNDETIAAALRAMFDLLSAINKRMNIIEKKMPSTTEWKIVSWFKRQKISMSIRKNRYKYKIKNKIKSVEKNDNFTSLAALFGKSKKEDKKTEEKIEECQDETTST